SPCVASTTSPSWFLTSSTTGTSCMPSPARTSAPGSATAASDPAAGRAVGRQPPAMPTYLSLSRLYPSRPESRVMTYDEILSDAQERMDKALAVLSNNLTGIRTGRANPGLVESLRVEVYGSHTPLKQLASIGTPEPQQIVIRPYDTSTIKEI